MKGYYKNTMNVRENWPMQATCRFEAGDKVNWQQSQYTCYGEVVSSMPYMSYDLIGRWQIYIFQTYPIRLLIQLDQQELQRAAF